MKLPKNEQRVYDALVYYDGWVINPHIAAHLMFWHNHTCKLLSFLMKKGLVESRRYTGTDGKKRHYCEYRLVKNG